MICNDYTKCKFSKDLKKNIEDFISFKIFSHTSKIFKKISFSLEETFYINEDDKIEFNFLRGDNNNNAEIGIMLLKRIKLWIKYKRST